MKAKGYFKRLLVCVMMVFVLGSLSGCGKMSAEDIIAKYTEQNLSIDNCEASMKMNFEMGQADTADTYKISMNSDIKMMVSPEYKAAITMAMDMGELGTYDVDTYIVKEGDAYWTYMYSSDTWMKQAIEADAIDEELKNYSDQVNMDLYIKNMKNFSLVGEETVEGKETYKIDGSISGEAIQEILDQSELSDYAGADTDGVDYSTLGSLTVSVWIGKDDFRPVKIYMDMTEMMGKLMDSQGAGITVPSCTMEFIYTGFGTVTDITLPEEAKDAISLDDAMEDLDEDDLDSEDDFSDDDADLEPDDDSLDDETYDLDDNNTADDLDDADDADDTDADDDAE